MDSFALDYGTQYNQNSQRPQPEIQSTYRPVTTVPTTTTTQRPAYKPVTYEYEDSLGGQVSDGSEVVLRKSFY